MCSSDLAAMLALPGFTGRDSRRQAGVWLAAIEEARALPETELPMSTMPHEGPPPARAWTDKDPAAAERLTAAKTAVAAIADEHTLPTENLLAPDYVRRLAWAPPSAPTADAVADVLTAFGARTWQVSLTAPALSGAFLRLAAHAANGTASG